MADSQSDQDPNFQVINAADFPKPKWNASRKLFNVSTSQLSMHGSASAKSDLFKDRYNLILQRVKRLPDFTKARDRAELTPIDALIGSPGRKFVLGLLTQLKEGQFFLEDPKGNVAVDLDDAVCTAGFFVEGSIVLVEGEYSDADGVFRVSTLGLPPTEGRSLSKQFLGGLDLFAPPKTKAVQSKYSRFNVDDGSTAAEVPSNAEFLILSDVHIDNPKVLIKLQDLLSECESDPPSAIVMMGNFSSNQGSFAENVSELKVKFAKLTEMLLSFPNIVESTHFIFIPGPTDPGGNSVSILPLPPLPNVITQSVRDKIPNAHFTSNPARIRFYGQDLILYRDDLMSRMRRHCIKEPVDQEQIDEPSKHLVKTICEEAHLCPLSLNVRPVHWNYDHCQYVYPLPDTIILADRTDQFEHHYDGCHCFNPGSFSADYSFISYSPADKTVNFSRIDE